MEARGHTQQAEAAPRPSSQGPLPTGQLAMSSEPARASVCGGLLCDVTNQGGDHPTRVTGVTHTQEQGAYKSVGIVLTAPPGSVESGQRLALALVRGRRSLVGCGPWGR